jgi:hypothetical protein
LLLPRRCVVPLASHGRAKVKNADLHWPVDRCTPSPSHAGSGPGHYGSHLDSNVPVSFHRSARNGCGRLPGKRAQSLWPTSAGIRFEHSSPSFLRHRASSPHSLLCALGSRHPTLTQCFGRHVNLAFQSSCHLEWLRSLHHRLKIAAHHRCDCRSRFRPSQIFGRRLQSLHVLYCGWRSSKLSLFSSVVRSCKSQVFVPAAFAYLRLLRKQMRSHRSLHSAPSYNEKRQAGSSCSRQSDRLESLATSYRLMSVEVCLVMFCTLAYICLNGWAGFVSPVAYACLSESCSVVDRVDLSQRPSGYPSAYIVLLHLCDSRHARQLLGSVSLLDRLSNGATGPLKVELLRKRKFAWQA